jgi:hypothetical protein
MPLPKRSSLNRVWNHARDAQRGERWEEGSHVKASSSAHAGKPVHGRDSCRCAGRKCGEPVRRPVERRAENALRTVPARVSRRCRGRQRSAGGCGGYRRQRPFRARCTERIGPRHGLHGLKPRSRIGAPLRQFRRRSLAGADG